MVEIIALAAASFQRRSKPLCTIGENADSQDENRIRKAHGTAAIREFLVAWHFLAVVLALAGSRDACPLARFLQDPTAEVGVYCIAFHECAYLVGIRQFL
jgi:hypothetical protein